MKTIKAVIFDMDGLIFDTERISFEGWRSLSMEEGYEMDREFYCTLIGMNFKGFSKLILDKYGESYPLDEIYKKKLEYQINAFENDGVPLKKGLHELLDFLNEEGYKVAVATSTTRDRAERMLELGEVLSKAQALVCGDDVVNSKPDPEIFLKAAKKLDVKPEECIVLEDSGAGIKAAYRAGMVPINIPDMKEPDEDMKSMSYKIFDSLLDVIELLKKE